MMINNLFPNGIDWPTITTRTGAIIAIWVAVMYLVRHLGLWVDRLYEEVRGHRISRREFRTLDALGDALLVTVGSILTLAVLELTPLLMSLLTAAGVSGVIIGFAVKDVAANLIAGVFILVDSPFSLGDYVAAGNVEGTIEQLSLRSTRIRTLAGPLISVPNSLIAANAITNYTINPSRRFVITLGFPPDTDLDAATQLLLEIATAEPRLSTEQPPQVYVGDVLPHSVQLNLICHAANSVWFKTQSDLKSAVLKKTQEAGLRQALPAQKIYATPFEGGLNSDSNAG
jgi:small-conductance mechanosensitive channel